METREQHLSLPLSLAPLPDPRTSRPIHAFLFHTQDQPGGGGRFAASYKKQFREQEARSLAARTAPGPGGGPPECACLVALQGGGGGGGGGEGGEASTSSSVVLGALDVRPPASAGGAHPKGVPVGDGVAAAVLNVAVSPAARRQGVGGALMQSAAALAASRWGAARLYASVAASNRPARALYAACGYVPVEGAPGAECDVAAGVAGAETLGRELLLCAEVEV